MAHAALLVILHFDKAQENRELSIGELDLFARLKNHVVGLPTSRTGPDYFTGAFLKKCWDTIKDDIMKVVHLFETLHFENSIG
jgi:hypothetical protein